MTVEEILRTKGGRVHVVAADASVRNAVAMLAERGVGAMPVTDGSSILGVFSERDLLQCVAREGGAALDQPVARAMSTPAITVGRGQSILGALALMTERRIRHLPVVDGGELVGIVSIGDLVKARIDRIEAEARAMRDYITTA